MKTLLAFLVISISAWSQASDPPAKPVREPTVAEMKAEIRLLKAQLRQQQVQCQIALLPEVRTVADDVASAQKDLDAIKKPKMAKAP